MAVNGVNSGTSGIYGTRPVISGLASGMDTESMIENAVSGIRLKITSLQQRRTKVGWQQEAYRSIIDKMANFTQKYASYTSGTNLLSASFFSSAVRATAKGTYADMISASGKTASDVQLLGVRQLATAATYTYSASGLTGAGSGTGAPAITGANEVDLTTNQPLSNVAGTLTLRYGSGRIVDLSFEDLDTYADADALSAAIEEKLSKITISDSAGNLVKGNKMIKVSVDGDGNIAFSDGQNAGNEVVVSSASGKIKDALGIDPSAKSSVLTVAGKDLVDEDAVLGDYLSGKEISVTLDGVTKKITLPTYHEDVNSAGNFQQGIQDALDDAFGAGKVQVGNSAAGGTSLKLSLTTQRGSTLRITGEAVKAMGMASTDETTYLNTGKKLGDLLGGTAWDPADRIAAKGTAREVKDGDGAVAYYVDDNGYRVAKDDTDGNWYRTDNEDAFLYQMKVNDKVVGSFSENTALESVMLAINNNKEAGVNVTYSKITNQFQFSAKETGTSGEIRFGSGLGQALFGDTDAASPDVYKKGQDAILSMSVNGEVFDGITRSSNTFDVDGLSVTLKGTFGAYENKDVNADGTVGADEYGLADVDAAKADAVSFTFTSDADKIIDAVKSMLEDYNEMITEIKNAYSTMPAQKSNHTKYEPLTDEDMADMSESAIKAYEEKAKQGILFSDRDLSSLYSKLRSATTPSGEDGSYLRSIGIGTSYSEGLTTLTLDEGKLRAALENDPDSVKNAFTKTVDNGADTNGLMQSLKLQLDAYAKVTGDKGILVNRAGTVKAPNSLINNSLQSQINNFDQQIERWETKLSDQVDYYTGKFSRLEQLIAQMNSQSSSLMSLMGGSQ